MEQRADEVGHLRAGCTAVKVEFVEDEMEPRLVVLLKASPGPMSKSAASTSRSSIAPSIEMLLIRMSGAEPVCPNE